MLVPSIVTPNAFSKLPMKLLALTQTPPPLHGQSLMAQLLVERLGPQTGTEVFHVNLPLSEDAADIGRWRYKKVLRIIRACFNAFLVRLKHEPIALYYIPAPGKRSALYRDWLVMLLCRPFFSWLVLHWHGVGLGEWLGREGTPPERWITRWLLGRADLAVVLAPELAADAQTFRPLRTSVVANGLPSPKPAAVVADRVRDGRFEVLFLGQCSRTKGLFDAVQAVLLLDQHNPGAFRLTVAGDFPSTEEKSAFLNAVGPRAGTVRYVGPVDEAKKRALFAETDVFCFPTYYPHEGQPLVLIEAMASDIPIVTTRWRAIPGMLPAEHVWLVEPKQPELIADALIAAHAAGPAYGALRGHYENHFTIEAHLAAFKGALDRIEKKLY
jgi:glycosyltransferase involved in cell wall biosynthesis